MNLRQTILLALAILAPAALHGQNTGNVSWATSVKIVSLHEAKLTITASILPGWHLYSQYLEDGGPQPTRFAFTPERNVDMSGFTEKGVPRTYHDDLYEMDITWYANKVVFESTIMLAEPKIVLTGTVEYMTCNAYQCVPGRNTLSVPIDLTKNTP